MGSPDQERELGSEVSQQDVETAEAGGVEPDVTTPRPDQESSETSVVADEQEDEESENEGTEDGSPAGDTV